MPSVSLDASSTLKLCEFDAWPAPQWIQVSPRFAAVTWGAPITAFGSEMRLALPIPLRRAPEARFDHAARAGHEPVPRKRRAPLRDGGARAARAVVGQRLGRLRVDQLGRACDQALDARLRVLARPPGRGESAVLADAGIEVGTEVGHEDGRPQRRRSSA